MKYFLSVLFFLGISLSVFGTHNRAGEITYKWISGNQFEVTVITYTKEFNAADRPKIKLNWGDNLWDSVQRVSKTNIANDIQKNVYISRHNYPGPGNYMLSIEDPNRNGGVVNIPNSLYTVFYIETLLSINPLAGNNNSVQLLYPPIDQGCTNTLFMHNPNAYDPDGDSLSYELVPCKAENGLPILGYTYPNATTSLSINAKTGDFIWNTPPNNAQGEYNISILIKEWRNGFMVGSVTRDMQIIILACNNKPPVFVAVRDTCIEAGKSLSMIIKATDPDNHQITLTATGGPFIQSTSPAQFPQISIGTGTVSAAFFWSTNCEHIRKEPYQVLFRAVDNGIPYLTTLMAWNITIVAPKVDSLSTQSFGGQIKLKWKKHNCPNTKGYIVYRKRGVSGFTPAECETGLPASTGFVPIDTLIGPNITEFIDNDKDKGLPNGIEFCYRVTAFYTNFIFLPQTYNESYTSDESCQKVKKDLPIFAKTDVLNTDKLTGSIDVRWSRPIELDTLQFPGPWQYKLYRQSSQTGKQLIKNVTSTTFANWFDTTYIDNGINTTDIHWSYLLDFYFNDTSKVGLTQKTTSTYLTLSPQSTRLKLTWNYTVPWTNDSFYVYKRNGASLDFLGKSFTNSYVDTGLVNGNVYCYLVQTFGSFKAPNFPDSIINHSQEICGSPIDTVAPCPPILKVAADCDNFKNDLTWELIVDECSDDLSYVQIWHTSVKEGVMSLIDSVNMPILTFIHNNLTNSIAGCYALKAVDTVGNVSSFSNIICVDNCPEFVLPNVFTPNNDGANDVYKPKKSKFIDHIEFTVYNRWGQQVFHTTDPAINWNGKNDASGEVLPTGGYIFHCLIFEKRLQGLTSRSIQGMIQIVY